VKFRQLEYFCAVAEEKSISAAARELHVAQPPISRQIAQLEEELGVQLFLRGSKGMVLTDAGQNLYQQAQQIFQDLRRVEDSVRSVGTGMSGRIKLGVIYSAMSYALHYINEYHSRYPQVELFIRVGSPQELIEALNRGELHALFLRTAAREPSGLQERILGEDALELIMREDMDPAPELSEVPIERLEGVPMCLLRSDDLWSYNDFLVQECQRSGFTPNVTCHCYDTPMAMQMVLSGFGISFLPRSILSTHPGAPAITSSCTALSRRSDPHERTSTTSVSVLGTIRSSPKRSTRTIPDVVCGTKASRTVSTKKREADESR